MEPTEPRDPLADERLRMLFDTIAEVNSTLHLDELLVRVVDRSLDLTQAERGILLLADADGPSVARDSNRRPLPAPVEYSHVVADRVMREGRSEVHQLHLAGTGEFPLTDSVNRLELRILMCVPLREQGRVTGVLYVDSRSRKEGEFGPEDLRLFEALASQASIAIERARLHEAALAAEALQERVRIAARIQERLVPARHVHAAGIEIYGATRPCEEIGGDYFDLFAEEEHRIRIAVGDVSGHGLKAALLMLTARAHLRSSLEWESNAGRILTHLDIELARDMEADEFMTLLLIEVDLLEHCVRYVSAGHEPPLILRAEGQVFERLDGQGHALSFRLDKEFRISDPVPLLPGDLLVLATDGIPEAKTPESGLFGEERLRSALFGLRNQSAEAIVTGVLGEVEEYVRAGAGQMEDDRTLVALKVAG